MNHFTNLKDPTRWLWGRCRPLAEAIKTAHGLISPNVGSGAAATRGYAVDRTVLSIYILSSLSLSFFFDYFFLPHVERKNMQRELKLETA